MIDIKIIILIVIVICLFGFLLYYFNKLNNKNKFIFKITGSYGDDVPIMKYDPNSIWTFAIFDKTIYLLPLTQTVKIDNLVSTTVSSNISKVITQVCNDIFVELDFNKLSSIILALTKSDVNYLYPELKTQVIECKDSFIDFYNKIIERCGNVKSAVIDIFTKNIFMLKMKVITLLLGLATSLRDLYKNIMTSVLSFVFNRLKLQGGSEEDKKTIKDRLRKFKDDTKNKFKSVGEKFVNLGEKSRTIILNYIDKHASEFNTFYKKTIWPAIRKFIDDVSKKCDLTILVKDLKGLNIDTLLPYIYYFITEIIFGLNILLDPETLLKTPTGYTSINKLMNIESGGRIFDNMSLEYLRNPITENNYGLRLEKYFKNIVLHEFLTELINDFMKLMTIFTDPERLITLFAGLILGVSDKLKYDLEHISNNIKNKLNI